MKIKSLSTYDQTLPFDSALDAPVCDLVWTLFATFDSSYHGIFGLAIFSSLLIIPSYDRPVRLAFAVYCTHTLLRGLNACCLVGVWYCRSNWTGASI